MDRRIVTVKTTRAGGATAVRTSASRREDVLSETGVEGRVPAELTSADRINRRTARLPFEREAFGRAWDALVGMDWQSQVAAGSIGGVRLA